MKFLRALNLGEYQNPAWPQKTYCFVSLFHDFIEKYKCDRTRVTHPKNPARTHIRTHKSMELRTSFAPRFPHARV